jgi:hypothetical protein
MGYGRQTEGESVDFISLPALTSLLVHPALDIATDPDYLTITARHHEGFDA